MAPTWAFLGVSGTGSIACGEGKNYIAVLLDYIGSAPVRHALDYGHHKSYLPRFAELTRVASLWRTRHFEYASPSDVMVCLSRRMFEEAWSKS